MLDQIAHNLDCVETGSHDVSESFKMTKLRNPWMVAGLHNQYLCLLTHSP